MSGACTKVGPRPALAVALLASVACAAAEPPSPLFTPPVLPAHADVAASIAEDVEVPGDSVALYVDVRNTGPIPIRLWREHLRLDGVPPADAGELAHAYRIPDDEPETPPWAPLEPGVGRGELEAGLEVPVVGPPADVGLDPALLPERLLAPGERVAGLVVFPAPGPGAHELVVELVDARSARRAGFARTVVGDEERAQALP